MDLSVLQKSLYFNRDELISAMQKELLGPGSEESISDIEHEIITDKPEQRYSVGILFPQRERFNVNIDDDNGDIDNYKKESDDVLDSLNVSEKPMTDNIYSENNDVIIKDVSESLDDEMKLSSQNMPSSMGITFFVKGRSEKLRVHVEFATYRKPLVEECITSFHPLIEGYAVPEKYQQFVSYDSSHSTIRLKEKIPYGILKDESLKQDKLLRNALYSLLHQCGTYGFIRVPHSCDIDVEFKNSDYVDNYSDLDKTSLNLMALRKRIDNDIFSITLMLVNTSVGRSNGINSIFQPKIRICVDDTSSYRF